MDAFDPAYWVGQFPPPPEDEPTSPQWQLPLQNHGPEKISPSSSDLNVSQNLPTGVVSSSNEVELPYHVNDTGPTHIQSWEFRRAGHHERQTLLPGPIFNDDCGFLPVDTFTWAHNHSHHSHASAVQDFNHDGHLPINPSLIFENGSAQPLQPHDLPGSATSTTTITPFHGEQNSLDLGSTSSRVQRQVAAIHALPNPISTVSVAPIPFASTIQHCDSFRHHAVIRADVKRTLLPKLTTSSQLQLASSATASSEDSVLGNESITMTSGLEKRNQDSGLPSTRRRALLKTCFDSGAGNRPQWKKRKEAVAVKPYMIYCDQFPLPANTGRGRVPPKRNKHPCLRCQDQKKGCYGGRPCERCASFFLEAVGRRSSQTLMWTECIESNLWELNIFDDAGWRCKTASGIIDQVDTRKQNPFGLADSSRVPNIELAFDVQNSKNPNWDASSTMRIAHMERLGLYIASQCPTGKRLLDLLAYVADPNHIALPSMSSSSNWRQPEAPCDRLLSRRYPLEAVIIARPLIWSAMCLHSSALCRFLDLGYNDFWHWFAHSVDAFIEVLNYFFQYLYRERKKAGAWPSPGGFPSAAIIPLCYIHCVMSFAEQNFGSLPSLASTLDIRIKDDEVRHLMLYCEHHSHKLQKQMRPEEKLFTDLCRSVPLELAQMDLSEWRSGWIESMGRKGHYFDDTFNYKVFLRNLRFVADFLNQQTNSELFSKVCRTRVAADE